MEVPVKDTNVNNQPMPQRQQKVLHGNKPGGKQNVAAIKVQDTDTGPAEKKSRFSHGNQNGGVDSVPNKTFGNKGAFMGNRNRNRNQNRGNFQNQAKNNSTNEVQTANQGNQDDIKNDPNSTAVNQIQIQNQNQNQNQNIRNRGNNNNNNNHGGGGGGGGNRDRSRGGRGGGGGGNSGQHNATGGGNNFNTSRTDEFFVSQRLRLISGPTHELTPIEVAQEAKFSGRNRLYIGNLTSDVTEEELREMFKPYGEIGEIFLNTEKNFAFLKVDYHVNAEKAKRALDGLTRKNRQLRVRFAPNATILRVRNLTQFVTNELLYKAFEIFGPLERANIIVDDRGKHTGEGVVEYAKKSSANACLRFCNDKCFFLTASLRPCLVEPFDVNDDNDGLPEKSLNKKTQEFNHERSIGPRFAEIGSFEHEYGTRWKQLNELFKTKQDALKRELKMEEEKLEAQMEYAHFEHETELLRQELRKRESDNERKKMEWELREKQAEEMRKREEENMRRQQSEMQTRMHRQEEDMRRRQQENSLFMQAQQLNSILDQQENCGNTGFDNFIVNNAPFDAFRGNNNNNPSMSGGNVTSNQLHEAFAFDLGGNNNSNQSGQGGGNQRGGNNAGNNNPWERRRRF